MNHKEGWEEVGSFHRVWLFAILAFKQNQAHSVLLTHEKRRAKKGRRDLSFPLPLFQESIPESTQASVLGSSDVSKHH